MGKKISPEEAVRIIKKKGIPFGEDYEFPYEIDTSGCRWFFGIRGPHNLHITGRKRAHIDRVDPRESILEHLRQDAPVAGLLAFILIFSLLLALKRLGEGRN